MESLADVAKGYACSQPLPHYHAASWLTGEQATLSGHSELHQAQSKGAS